jgi:voltage-gated potassium channel Kch
LPILVRAREEEEVASLQKHGATVVVLEVLEGSLLLAAASLKISGIKAVEANETIDGIRHRKSSNHLTPPTVSPTIPS